MLKIDPDDSSLDAFLGQVVTPVGARGISYHLIRKLGAGGMSVVFEARRRTQHGETPTVVKLMLPRFVLENQQIALTAFSKEASALQLLNDRVPPTPFVVRFYDVGFFEVQSNNSHLSLPWLSLEFVEGGAAGTTLAERVYHSTQILGHAFDAARALRAIDSICQGMSAVHEVGVIHRDLKPDNILCCGFGGDEIFKITDFGISRSATAKATFMGCPVGTPGYAPIEQANPNNPLIGPWTDVFAMGALVFYLLTGEDLFPTGNLYAAIAAAELPHRRSIRDTAALDPDLRASTWRCDRIDEVIARATSSKPQDRPRSARELGALFQSCFKESSSPLASQRKLYRSAFNLVQAPQVDNLEARLWVVRQAPGPLEEVRQVAWNSDGTALVVTSEGLAYWTGTAWQKVPLEGYPDPSGLRFVRALAPDQWLLGGDGATVASFTSRGLHRSIRGNDPRMTLTHASGNITDLAVVVATLPDSPPLLFGIAARRWMRRVPLEGVSSVNGIAQINDTTWLIVGRSDQGKGFASLFEPLQWQLTPLALPDTRAMLACTGFPELDLAVAVGTDGLVVVIEDGRHRPEIVPERPDLSAVALDPSRMLWACSLGRLYQRPLQPNATWSRAWTDPSWTSPLISLHASAGVVRAMSPDGGILEGHLRPQR